MFVYAAKYIYGFPPIEYYEPPAIYEVLYRKVVAVHTIHHYWTYDEGENYEEWTSVTLTVTWELHPVLNIITYASVVSSLNGLIYEREDDGVTTPTEYFKPLIDFTKPNDPDGNPFQVEVTPYGVILDAYTEREITAVGTGTLSSEGRALGGGLDGLQVRNRIETVITQSEPMNPTTIGAELAAMLATVPLQRPNQAAVNAVDGVGDPLTGYLGFNSTQIATYLGNLVSLTYDTEGTLQQEISSVLTSDLTCVAGQNREQTFTPAALNIVPATSAGTGGGTLYVVSDPYWIFTPTLGIDETIFSSPGYGWTAELASATGKKSLLARIYPDDWTIFLPQEAITGEYLPEEATCLGSDIDECYRYYYPSGADAGGSGVDSINLTFTGEGIIYREIPFISSPTPPCPEGVWPEGTNPCD
jgi:hypothetical protein